MVILFNVHTSFEQTLKKNVLFLLITIQLKNKGVTALWWTQSVMM